MPEASTIKYSLKELTALMLKDSGIAEGLWMLYSEFSTTVTNVEGGESSRVGPAVIAVLINSGIQRVEEPNPLSVDASELAGATPKRRRAKAKT